MPKPPGLISIPNKDGSPRLYWRAPKRARDLGYEPSHVRLHAESDEELKSLCARYQSEALDWLAQMEGAALYGDGVETLSDLFREYRLRPESPYNAVKYNSRRTYEKALAQIEAEHGEERLEDINLAVLKRWYSDALGANNHIRKAHGWITTLRRAVSFGVAIEITACERLDRVLSHSRFQSPGRRTVAITREQVEAVIASAKAHWRPSIALGTALQFECGLRQRDVIGEWAPIMPREAVGAYVMNGKQWKNGLTWTDIDDELILTKTTTKTGSVVSHDLKLCPLVMALLEGYPEERRVGPIIISETTGIPYAQDGYRRNWRIIADAAGIPRSVWNMDARSGAATEADESGVSVEDLRATLGHSNAKTTHRYMRGDGLEQSRRVAALRLKGRTG